MNNQPRYIEVDLGDVIIFYDSRFPPDLETGTQEFPTVNRVAVVVDDAKALFIGCNKFGLKRVEVFSLGLPVMEGQNITILKSSFGESNGLIVNFFLSAQNDPNVFEAGLKALHAGNLPLLLGGHLFPEEPIYLSDEEYLTAWHNLKSCLLPFDSIFTRDNESKLSRFIAWSTHGPWSHVAQHVSDGRIWESVTSGVREASIDVYKGRRFRVAIYRHIQLLDEPMTAQRAAEIVSSHPFRPNSYNYVQAARYGLKSFFGDHSHALVPNSMIYQGIYVPIAQA